MMTAETLTVLSSRCFMYSLLRNILFCFDAEKVHYFSMNFLRILCKVPFIKNIISSIYTPKHNAVTAFGLSFRNPIGLAAGFDKNALYLNELEALGFGFVEIGTVTPLPQEGNPKPRLFRLPKDSALINRMGFNNDGVIKVAERLKEWRSLNTKRQSEPLIIGGNIGKNKATANEDAWKDYEICFKELFDHVDYFVVNVSSPNTPGLRALQSKDSLRKILTPILDINNAKEHQKPVLLKIAPDLELEEVDEIIEVAIELQLSGLVVANTTISRDNLKSSPSMVSEIGMGGLSGKPLTQKATDLIHHIHNNINGTLPIIGSGGIFTADDAREKKEVGAVLLQVWTGFIYKGPAIVRSLCKGLTRNS